MAPEKYKNATSKTDLCNILSKCTFCYNSTKNGDLIIAHTELPNIFLNNSKKGKKKSINLLVNTKSADDQINNNNQEPYIIGHWFLINVALDRHQPKATICDSINDIAKDPTVMANIDVFCSNNSLKLYDLNEKYQNDFSDYCGYISIGIISYLHDTKKINKILTLKKIFQRNSVKSNEKIALKMYEKHFFARHSSRGNML